MGQTNKKSGKKGWFAISVILTGAFKRHLPTFYLFPVYRGASSKLGREIFLKKILTYELSGPYLLFFEWATAPTKINSTKRNNDDKRLEREGERENEGELKWSFSHRIHQWSDEMLLNLTEKQTEASHQGGCQGSSNQ